MQKDKHPTEFHSTRFYSNNHQCSVIPYLTECQIQWYLEIVAFCYLIKFYSYCAPVLWQSQKSIQSWSIVLWSGMNSNLLSRFPCIARSRWQRRDRSSSKHQINTPKQKRWLASQMTRERRSEQRGVGRVVWLVGKIVSLAQPFPELIANTIQ